eukprot:1346110-Prorocentrum_lima.AAC.1
MKAVQQARLEHDSWLDLTPAQPAVREASFMFGDEFPIPPNGNTLDNHRRVDIVEAIPKHIQVKCKDYGIFSTVKIIVRVMRE